MRTLLNYYNPDRRVYLTASHHIARALREMGLDDPRAIAPVAAPEPPAPKTSRWALLNSRPAEDDDYDPDVDDEAADLEAARREGRPHV